jgi:hypothetical protein
MKQSPQLEAARSRMLPGRVTRDGFLGSDRRSLSEILDEDANAVRSLGLTHADIACRMEYFAEKGRAGLGTTVTVDQDYEVRVESVRGFLPCPWQHEGLFRKTNVFLKNLLLDEELMWSDLTMHMIRAHGFYEGKGSTFRVGPRRAARVLGLLAP